MQKLRSFLIISGGLFWGLFCSADSFAESVCRADVSYSWAKIALNESGGEEVARTATPVKGLSTPSSPVVSRPEIHKVHFTSIERRSGSEEMARTLLEGDVQRQKAKASERCRHAHESFGDCVSTKLSTKGMVLNSLSFSARSQVEKALLDECRLSQGECQAVTASEPLCVTIGKEKAKESGGPDSAGEGQGASSDTEEKSGKTEEKPPVQNKTNGKKK
jgi:hypothetical protein